VPLDQIAPFSEHLYSSLLIQRRYAIFDLEKENPLRSLFENLRVNEGKYFGLSNALVYKKV